jgi:hypothetical protein
MLYDWSMESNRATLLAGSKIDVVCARMGGANTTPLFFLDFSAAHFAKQNTNSVGVQSEGAAEFPPPTHTPLPPRSRSLQKASGQYQNFTKKQLFSQTVFFQPSK